MKEIQISEKPCPICFGSGFLSDVENQKIKCNHCDSTGKVSRRLDGRTLTGYEKLSSEREQI